MTDFENWCRETGYNPHQNQMNLRQNRSKPMSDETKVVPVEPTKYPPTPFKMRTRDFRAGYMAGFAAAPTPEQAEVDRLRRRVKELESELDETEGALRLSINETKATEAKLADLERIYGIQVMQLAGCMTVAYANTEKALSKVLSNMHPDYQCAAIDTVAEAIRREIAERHRAEASETNFAIEQAALKAAEAKLEAARIAVCLYMKSEGCTCCQNIEAHDKYQREIADILSIPVYEDGSGVDYFSVANQALLNKEQTK